jgi:hypothetical protein
MKIEIDIPEELIEKLGKEAVEVYLQRKAEALHQSVIKQSTVDLAALSEDKESTDIAWQKFNKRGMSC